MRDERDGRLDRLLKKVREAPPDTEGVEREFETRLLARIRERRAAGEPWTAWTWRLAPLFLAVALLLGVWNLFPAAGNRSDIGTTLSSGSEEVALVSYLSGE